MVDQMSLLEADESFTNPLEGLMIDPLQPSASSKNPKVKPAKRKYQRRAPKTQVAKENITPSAKYGSFKEHRVGFRGAPATLKQKIMPFFYDEEHNE
jgi:hypothetical protein